LSEGVLGDLSKVVSLLVELLEQDDSSSGDAEFGQSFSIVSGSEEDIIVGSSDSLEDFQLISGSTEVNNSDFGSLGEGLDFSDSGEGPCDGAGFLLHPGDDFGLGSSSVVLAGDSVGEELESGEALDLELAGDGLVDGGVDFGERERGVVVSEGLGSSGVLGSESFAVTAPGSVEFNEDVLVVLDGGFEVVVS